MTMEKINEIMKNGEKKIEKRLYADDPWWGERWDTVIYYIYEGKKYEYNTDRDGWPELHEVA